MSMSTNHFNLIRNLIRMVCFIHHNDFNPALIKFIKIKISMIGLFGRKFKRRIFCDTSQCLTRFECNTKQRLPRCWRNKHNGTSNSEVRGQGQSEGQGQESNKMRQNNATKIGLYCYIPDWGENYFFHYFFHFFFFYSHHINGWVQACGNSSALAMEIAQSCTKPVIYHS